MSVYVAFNTFTRARIGNGNNIYFDSFNTFISKSSNLDDLVSLFTSFRQIITIGISHVEIHLINI